MKITKNKAGFSLIELTIVVTVIGALSALAIPKFQNISAQSRLSIAKRHAKQIVKAAQYRTTIDGANFIVSLDREADGTFNNVHNLDDYHYALNTDIKIITLNNTNHRLNLELIGGKYRIFGYTHDGDVDPGPDVYNTAIFAAPTGDFLAFANVDYDGSGNSNINTNNSTGGQLPGAINFGSYEFADPH